jgi:hypothetical protein
MSKHNQKTLLTEQQARTLAHWWGGEYHEISPAAGGDVPRHGVVLTGHKSCSAQADAPTWVFSLEEARDLENRRGFQDAANPDWVG